MASTVPIAIVYFQDEASMHAWAIVSKLEFVENGKLDVFSLYIPTLRLTWLSLMARG